MRAGSYGMGLEQASDGPSYGSLDNWLPTFGCGSVSVCGLDFIHVAAITQARNDTPGRAYRRKCDEGKKPTRSTSVPEAPITDCDLASTPRRPSLPSGRPDQS
jgi:hypothetical protein